MGPYWAHSCSILDESPGVGEARFTHTRRDAAEEAECIVSVLDVPGGIVAPASNPGHFSLLCRNYIHERFGTVANSLASLVQILTLDSWSETPRYIQEHSEKMSYILLVWALYVLFILLAPLMMLNCLNAIFVEGVVTKITHKKLERLRAEVRAKQLVAEELHVVFDKLDKDGDGRVTAAELDAALADSIVNTRVRNLGLKRHHLLWVLTHHHLLPTPHNVTAIGRTHTGGSPR